MGGRSVRVLHISDLHMRTVDGPQAKRARLEAASRWRVLGDKWTANLDELRKDGVPFDLVVFTGDLGDWGHPTDYPRALAFLKDTCAALAVPLDRLFVIPGNHDVDRKAQAAAWRWVRKNIGADPRAFSEWMAGDGPRELRRNERRDKILERQRAFWTAVEKELGRPALLPSRSPHGRIGYRQAVTLPGLSQPIQVIGLDTAWLAGDKHDSSALRLTEHQVSLLTTMADGEPLPGFRLALMHHRFADLVDEAEARQHMAERVDLLLHGHQHAPTADVLQGPDHQLLVLATGCLYEGDAGHRFPNACQVIDLALDEHARPQGAKVRFRGWSDRGLFWGDDALLYRSAREGRLRLGRGPHGWRFEEDGEEPRAPAPGRTPTPVLSNAPAPAPPPPRTEAIDFTTERQRHARFVGREEELAQLDKWLLGTGSVGWVLVTGGPGMGKSALLSQWLARRAAAGVVVPHHFVSRQANRDQPEMIAASLAAQIEAMFPDLRDPDARPEARLIDLLSRASKHLGKAERLMVVVVDGLDETRADPGDNPLPHFLPLTVPPWIRLLCAMRKEYPHLSWIEARNPARRIDLDAPQWAASNEAVVRGFWQSAATEYEPPLPDETVASAIERAEGNVLHAVMLHDELQSMAARERRADRVPPGIDALIGKIWDRAAAHSSVRVGLGLLCAAQEALSLDVIAELAGWGPDAHEERARFLRESRQLLLEEPALWSGAVAYRARHEWVRKLMADRLGAAAIRAHHATLAQKLATWPAPSDPSARRYALRHVLLHRVEAGAWQDAWRCAADMRFLEAKCREHGAHEVEADVARTAERSRASGDESLRGRFDDLARALGRESHWLRTAPEATAALVWNRLRQLGWSTEEINQQLHMPDGSMFVRVRHWATRESPALIRNFVGHSSAVLGCAVTLNGRRVISASRDDTLKVWDLDTGRERGSLLHPGVTACAVTPNGRWVISASHDKTLKVWDPETGGELRTLHGHTASVTACAVMPEGRRVVSASEDNTLKVWDLETGGELRTLRGHTASVTACAVMPKSARVVSASEDNTLKVWDIEAEHELRTLRGHTKWVRACAITPDERLVVSASEDQTLKLWDPNTGMELRTLEGHAAGLRTCAVTPNGQWVVYASNDKTLKLRDLHSDHELRAFSGHTASIRACAVTPDGRRVVSSGEDNTLKVWSLEVSGALAPHQGHADFVRACAVTMDGRLAISASDDTTLKVWDLETGRELSTLRGHTRWVRACAVVADKRWLVSASEDKTLKLWDLDTGRELRTLRGHTSTVRACAVTPDGQWVVSASDDQTLKVWDLATGQAIWTLAGHTSWVLACMVAPDGRCVVSASEDRTLKVWDLATGQEVWTLAGHADSVRACAVTPDGRRVVSASDDKTLKVWDLATGQAMWTLAGHTARVNMCVIHPDGWRAISASEDHTLRVWDLLHGVELRTLRGHTAEVTAYTVAPDALRAISLSGDSTLRVWTLDNGACECTYRTSATLTAVAVTAKSIITGDSVGAVWFLDWPLASHHDAQVTIHESALSWPGPQRPHTILFLAANQRNTDRLALDEECVAIDRELRISAGRSDFDFRSKWISSADELVRHLNELQPSVIHFSGHGSTDVASIDVFARLGDLIKRTSPVTRLVVLNASNTASVVTSLGAMVDCVVGMAGTLSAPAARSFAVAFYRALGDRRSVGNAVDEAVAVLEKGLQGIPIARVRDGLGANQIFLSSVPDVPAPNRREHSHHDDPKVTQSPSPRSLMTTSTTNPEPLAQNPDRPEGDEFAALIVFVLLKGLNNPQEGPLIPKALSTLNAALRAIDSKAYVLSTIAGAIIVVPDDASWDLEKIFELLRQAKTGFPLRLGVTHGLVEVVVDVDDEKNLIGGAVNIAARLASSKNNPGTVVHETYANHVAPDLPRSHWLHSKNRQEIIIAGKEQDPPFRCFAVPESFAPGSRGEDAIVDDTRYESREAILIAYDLPKFSSGDRAQLRKRFTRLGYAFKKLRPAASLPALLSPGGDGGVFILRGISLAEAGQIASRLRELSEIESHDLANAIAIRIRIGVHYGRIAEYTNARGVKRPAGLELFVADEIANDSHARNESDIIVTSLLAESMTGGSREQLAASFKELPSLREGPAAGVKRFVRRSVTLDSKKISDPP